MKKFILGLFVLVVSLVSFSSAGLVRTSGTYNGSSVTFNSDGFVCLPIVYDQGMQHYCMQGVDYCKYGFGFPATDPNKTYKEFTFNYGQDWNGYGDINFNSICSYVVANTAYQLHFPQGTNDFTYYFYSAQNDCSTVESQLSSCQSSVSTLSGSLATCQSDLTTCQNSSSSCDYSGYVLESEITSSYCETRFDLIDPSNCPASGGSGDVNWSSFFVNNRQIQGASNIYLWLPEFLNWDYTYIDNGSTLEIDVENEGDQEYIENILDVQTYHPTSDEFAVSFVGYLTLLMPYIIITLFVLFVWKLIKRVFK